MNLKNMIWYEKFRPTDITGMALDKNRISMFQDYINDKDLPHLLFYGPVGGGKTTIAKILIDKIGCPALEMNSSAKDRGVDTVKSVVSLFAGSKPPAEHRIKIAFFDEAEGLTRDAQMALKNMIETYSNTTRFIFTCNDVNKITEAIQSRCLGIYFEQMPKRKVIQYCIMILDDEDIEYEVDDIKVLVNRIYPDMRSIVNWLQLCSISGDFDISSEKILIVNPEEIFELIKRGDLRSIREKVVGIQTFKFLLNDLFNRVLEGYKHDFKLASRLSLCIMDSISREVYFVADKEINFVGCCIELMTILDVRKVRF